MTKPKKEGENGNMTEPEVKEIPQYKHTKSGCPNCEAYKMHYESKLDEVKRLIGSFPPYHGNFFSYTKEEVEAWLEKAYTVLGMNQK